MTPHLDDFAKLEAAARPRWPGIVLMVASAVLSLAGLVAGAISFIGLLGGWD